MSLEGRITALAQAIGLDIKSLNTSIAGLQAPQGVSNISASLNLTSTLTTYSLTGISGGSGFSSLFLSLDKMEAGMTIAIRETGTNTVVYQVVIGTGNTNYTFKDNFPFTVVATAANPQYALEIGKGAGAPTINGVSVKMAAIKLP